VDLGWDATSPAADVLCRAILETSSLAWWLLEPGLDARARLARSLVYQLHSAARTGKAIEALDLGPEDTRAGYGPVKNRVGLATEPACLNLHAVKVTRQAVLRRLGNLDTGW
jgi:hypothetical protein